VQYPQGQPHFPTGISPNFPLGPTLFGVALPFERAYATFHIKSFDDELRVIEGVASTPTPDRLGDIIEAEGAQYILPLPLLWQHDKNSPIGFVTFAKATKAGISIRAQIAKGVLPRIDEAWALIKSGLVRGLSIGFRPLNAEPMRKGGLHVKSWEWLELSAVTIPANVETSILSVKQFDAASRAPTEPARASRALPGASGTSRASAMTYSEQIQELQNDLQVKSARLEEIEQMDDRGELGDDESKERDTIVSDIQARTKKIERLSAMEAAMMASAKGFGNGGNGHKLTTGVKVSVRERSEDRQLPPGTLFTRYAMAVAAGKGSMADTLMYAKRWDRETPEVSAYIKAIAGTSVVGSPAWGGELVNQSTLASEFIALVRPMTILGRLNGVRNVPFNIAIPVQTGGSTVNWVGEEAVKPVTELAFSLVELGYDKIAGIVVLTEELVRLSSPSAEETVRRDLTEQIAQFMDEQFLDPTITVSASRPASITNGIASPAASGDDADALYNDLNTALATFDNADVGTETVHIIMPPSLSRGIATMRNALGQTEFGAMTPQGGSLMGYPVIVSANAPAATIVLVKANEILVADDGRVTLDASNQATLDMAGGSSPTFSLWQKNCVGIRAERWVTWKRRRDAGSVAVIDTASYGPGAGSPG
jgi:HK97 family phage major capsid protein/HK97 family phage prohead protease